MAVSVFNAVAQNKTNVLSDSMAVDAGADADRVLLVLVIWGSGGTPRVIGTPTFDSVSMTAEGDQQQLNQTNRQARLFSLEDPSSGSNTLAWSIDSSANSLTAVAVVLHGADAVEFTQASNFAKGASQTPQASITPTAATSKLLGFFAGSSGTNDPYTPDSGWTEELDAGANNHTWNVISKDAAGTTSETAGTTAAESDNWGAWAVEVTEAGGGTPATVTPGVVSATVAVPSPTGVAPATVTPAVVAGVSAVPGPEAIGGTVVEPAVVAGVGAVPAPSAVGAAKASPTVVSTVVAVPTPTVTVPGAGATVTPDVASLLVTVPQPVAVAPATVSPSVVALSVAVPQPTVIGGTIVSPGVVALVVAVPSVTVTSAGIVSPAVVPVVVTVPTPVVVFLVEHLQGPATAPSNTGAGSAPADGVSLTVLLLEDGVSRAVLGSSKSTAAGNTGASGV